MLRRLKLLLLELLLVHHRFDPVDRDPARGPGGGRLRRRRR